MANQNKKIGLLWLAALLLLLVLPLGLNNYVQFVVNTMLVYSLAAIGFNVVIGYLGQLAFANAAFFGIGAYAAGLSMTHLGFPYPLALVASAAVGGLAGALVGLPALRVRGYYLAIVTLAFGELMRWVYVHADGFTYGASGFNVPQVSLFGLALNETGKYYVFLLVVLLGLITTRGLMKSRIGRAFVAVRNSEAAAASTGVAVLRTKVVAFMEWRDCRACRWAICLAQWTSLARHLRSVADADALRYRHDRRAGQSGWLHHWCCSVDWCAGVAAQLSRARRNRVQSFADGGAVPDATRYRRPDCRPYSRRPRAPVPGVAHVACREYDGALCRTDGRQ